jgi:hypothetical protein
MNWADLQELRRQGLKPSLPVLVTTARDCRTYDEEGFAVIRHSPGQPFPAELLDGLRVMLFLGNCDRAASVVRAIQTKGVTPVELRTWCACFGRLDSCICSCATVHMWETVQ